MTVQKIPFMKVYRMTELAGQSYFKALRSMVSYYEWSMGREPRTIGETIRWTEHEDILFHENGDMIGGDE